MPRFKKSLDLQISFLESYFKKITPFPVFGICFIEILHDKWCSDKSVGQTENGLEGGFVIHGLNSVILLAPKVSPYDDWTILRSTHLTTF